MLQDLTQTSLLSGASLNILSILNQPTQAYAFEAENLGISAHFSKELIRRKKAQWTKHNFPDFHQEGHRDVFCQLSGTTEYLLGGGFMSIIY